MPEQGYGRNEGQGAEQQAGVEGARGGLAEADGKGAAPDQAVMRQVAVVVDGQGGCGQRASTVTPPIDPVKTQSVPITATKPKNTNTVSSPRGV